ncbi:Succinyl-diaminopimelate desuccinylase [Arthrobacter sp. SO5]|uniref:M20/M25/M40 family metallo-hydrolase n=1 Tax=Arthrobacter sp. SO5 TaxID=1897055 RepID=UPI001E4212C2|nr:M20/M25/M40 family metallo-hydrolase [Arthrobacter sp. SO5]MCB5273601.1 Succinyl-diaminopimelate desuccinylase [Arthrobacter sp. SO5]
MQTTDPAVTVSRAAAALAQLVQFRTVSSRTRSEVDAGEFEGFIAALPRLFPAVHATLELERVNGHALLYRWPGTDAGAASRPAVLMAHYDVVPAGDPDGWTRPPFSGHNDGTYLWGRGTLDDKGQLVAILAAAEALLGAGFTPRYDLYFSFGNNEETAGDSAATAAALLAGRGVAPWLVLDEGGAVAGGAFPGVKRPVAVVGVAEKGILDVELLTRDPGGHASTPPRMGATARLARAITRIERSPFPQSMPDVTAEMLRRFGPHSPAPMRTAFANLSLLRMPLTLLFGRLGNETNAMTRTTVAITMLEGSAGANVLAATAKANANIRVAVGETVDGTVERLRKIIRDPKVELRIVEGNEPSPVSPSTGAPWRLVEDCIASVFPEAIITPYIMMGGTDSRRFTGICGAVYRFAPFSMDAEARGSIHAVDEKILLETLDRGVRFYETLIRKL